MFLETPCVKYFPLSPTGSCCIPHVHAICSNQWLRPFPAASATAAPGAAPHLRYRNCKGRRNCIPLSPLCTAQPGRGNYQRSGDKKSNCGPEVKLHQELFDFSQHFTAFTAFLSYILSAQIFLRLAVVQWRRLLQNLL